MSSSSSASTSRRSRSTASRAEARKVCNCGTSTPLLTAWTTGNAMRRFWSCPIYEKNRRCDYFEWLDAQFPQQVNAIIGHLIEERNSFRDRCDKLRIKEEVLKVMEKSLKNREMKLQDKKKKLKSMKEVMKMKETRVHLVTLVLVLILSLVCFKFVSGLF